jgi:hypothetical protein
MISQIFKIGIKKMIYFIPRQNPPEVKKCRFFRGGLLEDEI